MSGRRLLIVWWSRTGASEQLSEALETAAAAVQDVVVRRIRCDAVTPQDMLEAEAYAFCCPENLASVAGMMKEFFDRCYYPVLGRLYGRALVLVVSAGSDGLGAVRQMERIVTGWRLRLVAPALIVNTHAQTPAQILAPKEVAAADLTRARELGSLLAEGLAMGVF